jgi:hypothetical protein
MVKYAYSNPKEKRGKYRVEPSVFAVHKEETVSGRYHTVAWAKDGNLNAAHQRGNVRRFRLWANAREFANQKAKELKTKAVFS